MMGAQLNGRDLSGVNARWYSGMYQNLFDIPSRWRLRWDLF